MQRHCSALLGIFVVVYIVAMPPVYLTIERCTGDAKSSTICVALYDNVLIDWLYNGGGVLAKYGEWWRRQFGDPHATGKP